MMLIKAQPTVLTSRACHLTTKRTASSVLPRSKRHALALRASGLKLPSTGCITFLRSAVPLCPYLRTVPNGRCRLRNRYILTLG